MNEIINKENKRNLPINEKKEHHQQKNKHAEIFGEKQKKKVFKKIFYSIAVSVSGFFFYYLGKKIINFPINWIGGINEEIIKEIKNEKFFFSGIETAIFTNQILWLIFTINSLIKKNNNKEQDIVNKNANLLNKIINFVISIIVGIYKFYPIFSNNKINISDKTILLLFVVIINFCILNSLIQTINSEGICSAISVMLFFDYLDKDFFWLENIKKNNNITKSAKIIEVFGILIISAIYIWLTNLKWVFPIASNNIAKNNIIENEEQKIINYEKPKLELKASFSLISLVYLEQQILFIDWLLFFKNSKEEEGIKKIIKLFIKNTVKDKFELKKLKETRYLFDNLLYNLLSLTIIFIQKIKLDTNPKDISQNLKNGGIYLENVYPGEETENILLKATIQMIIFWFVTTTTFRLLFFSINKTKILSFYNWINQLNIAIDIIKQIDSKQKFLLM